MPASIATQNGTASLAFYASKSSIKDIFTYSHIENIFIVPFHKLPNSKTTTHHQEAPTLENTAAPSNRTTHFYYPLVTQRGCPSPRVFAERGRAPALICIPPRPELATYRVIPASNGRDCAPKGYDGPHRRESTTRFQRHPLKLGFPQCSFICLWYIYAHFPYVITASYSALGNEARFRARRQAYP